MRHLTGREGEVTVGRLAAHLYLSGAFVTSVTNRLARAGYIKKRPDSADRRRVILEVTPKGDDLLAELAPVQRMVNDVQFGGLSAISFINCPTSSNGSSRAASAPCSTRNTFTRRRRVTKSPIPVCRGAIAASVSARGAAPSRRRRQASLRVSGSSIVAVTLVAGRSAGRASAPSNRRDNLLAASSSETRRR